MRSMVVLVAAVIAVAGCGASEDRRQARAVAEQFYDAVRAGDGARACRQLSAAVAAQLEDRTGRACPAVVTRLRDDGGAVAEVAVFVTSARVLLRGGEAAYLDREPAGWKLSAVGCRFEDGRPRDRPADCELEA